LIIDNQYLDKNINENEAINIDIQLTF